MSAEGDKRSVDVQDAAYGINESSEHVDEKKGNAADRADMYRMGKTQEMTVRRKPFFSLLYQTNKHDRETFASCPSLASL